MILIKFLNFMLNCILIKCFNKENIFIINKAINANLTIDLGLIDEILNTSHLKCISKCSRDCNCFTVLFNKEKSICKLYEGFGSLDVSKSFYLYSKQFKTTTTIDNFKGEVIYKFNHTLGVHSLAVLQNGYLASGSDDNVINIWNPNNGLLIRSLINHTLRVSSLMVLKNGLLASGSFDQQIKIWNPYNGSLIKSLTGHTSEINCLEILENGYLASGSNDKTIRIWNTDNDSTIRTIDTNDFVYGLTFLKYGCLASGSNKSSNQENIKIWDPNNGILIKSLNEQSSGVKCFVVFMNGYLASGLDDGTVKIWDTLMSLLKILLNEPNGINSLTIFQNDYLVTGFDKFIHIWNPLNKTLIKSLNHHTSLVKSLVVLNNGYLASASQDNTIYIWN